MMYFTKEETIEYFKDLTKIRYEIANLLKECGLVRQVMVDDAYGRINQFHGNIKPTGAFGIEYYYGTPDYILTPYGKVRIQSAVVAGDGYQKQEFYKKFNERFGVRMVKEVEISKWGAVGPYVSITKLPWKGNVTLPVFELSDVSHDELWSKSKEIEKEIDEIYDEIEKRNQAPEKVVEKQGQEQCLTN